MWLLACVVRLLYHLIFPSCALSFLPYQQQNSGGLRLTVAEYLTPSLQHVTKVGGARYDSGVKPDIRCDSTQGIPQNVGADLCVGVALDVLECEGG